MRRAETARRDAAEERGVPVWINIVDDNQEMLFPAITCGEYTAARQKGRL